MSEISASNTRSTTTSRWSQAATKTDAPDVGAAAMKVANANTADTSHVGAPVADPVRAAAQRGTVAAHDKQRQTQLLGTLPAGQRDTFIKFSGDAARDEKRVLDVLASGAGKFDEQNGKLFTVGGAELWRTERDNVIAKDMYGGEARFLKGSPVETKLRELEPWSKETDEAKLIERITSMSDDELRAFASDEARFDAAHAVLNEGEHPNGGRAIGRLRDARLAVAPPRQSE